MISYHRLGGTPEAGLGWFAGADLHPGKVIFKEPASVVAPADQHSCVECLVNVSEPDDERCPGGCGLVMCQKCQTESSLTTSSKPVFCPYHDEDECRIMSRISEQTVSRITKESLFNLIFPIRFAALKSSNPDLFHRLLSLESHEQERKTRIDANRSQDYTLDSSHKSFGTMCQALHEGLRPLINPEESARIIGVEFTNAFELRLGSSCNGRALFLETSRINHSCVANLSHSNVLIEHVEGRKEETEKWKNWTLDEKRLRRRRFLMEIKTQRSVKSGKELTIRYNSVFEAQSLNDRLTRLLSLDPVKSVQYSIAPGLSTLKEIHGLRDWFFLCRCPRCRDPTEFSTFTSSNKCLKCQRGYFIHHQTESSEESRIISIIRREFPQHFHCDACGNNNNNINAMHAEDDDEFEKIKQVEGEVNNRMAHHNVTYQMLLELLRKSLECLHDSHYIVIALKRDLLFHPLVPEEIRTMSLRCDLAQDLLRHLEILDPGWTVQKRRILRRLLTATIARAKVRADTEMSSACKKKELVETLIRVSSIQRALEKCV